MQRNADTQAACRVNRPGNPGKYFASVFRLPHPTHSVKFNTLFLPINQWLLYHSTHFRVASSTSCRFFQLCLWVTSALYSPFLPSYCHMSLPYCLLRPVTLHHSVAANRPGISMASITALSHSAASDIWNTPKPGRDISISLFSFTVLQFYSFTVFMTLSFSCCVGKA